MEQQNQQAIQNQNLNQPFSDETKQARSKRMKIALIALGAVLLTVGGILLLQNIQPAPSPTPIAQQTPPPTPQQEVLDTTDWQTYRNDEFGFEVKYPSDWFAYDDRNFPCEYVLFSRKQISDCRFADYIPADFYVFKGDLYNPFPKSLPNQIYTPFILDGEKGVINFATEQSDGPRAKDTNILVNHNGYGYMVTFLNIDYQGNHEQVFDQILSTFRFIE